jgi:hypothetical protein
MKVLFFMLALANVMLVMWEYHKGSFSPTSSQTSKDIYTELKEKIVLVSELEGNTSIGSLNDNVPMLERNHPVDMADKNQIEEKTKKDQTLVDALNDMNSHIPEASKVDTPQNGSESLPVGSAETKGVNCLEAGPFTNEEVYKDWEKRLNGFVYGISRDEPLIKDYLVYYPAAESMLLSKSNLKMLQDKGIKDFWMFTHGEEKGQISLGVFNREEKALILKDELISKGINAEIKPRYKTKMQKFAIIRGVSNVNENLELLKKTYPKVNVNYKPSLDTENCFE